MYRKITHVSPSKSGKRWVLITEFKDNDIKFFLQSYEQYWYNQINETQLPSDKIIESIVEDKYQIHGFVIRKRTIDDPLYDGESRPVLGLERYFLISENGDLYSIRTNKVMSKTTNQNGYMQHVTKLNGRVGRYKVIKISRAVAKAFHPNPSDKPAVNHINGIKLDDRRTNLEWVSNSENTQHALRTNLIVPLRGHEVRNASFTPDQILEIRRKGREYGVRKLAREYGVVHQVILRILNFSSYKNTTNQ